MVHSGQRIYEVQDEVVDGLVVGDGVEGVVDGRFAPTAAAVAWKKA